MKTTISLCLAATSLLLTSSLPAAVATFNEAGLGDFSSAPGTPTALNFVVGDNQLIGSVSTGSDTRDYITFTIAPGTQLTQLLVNEYDNPAIGGVLDGNRGFHAIIAGATSFIPNGGNIGSFLGSNHFDPPGAAGADYLPVLAAAPTGGTGFSVPLGPGTYTYLIQQTGPEVSNYELSFTIVPEPGTYGWLALAGLSVVACRLRRRR